MPVSCSCYAPAHAGDVANSRFGACNKFYKPVTAVQTLHRSYSHHRGRNIRRSLVVVTFAASNNRVPGPVDLVLSSGFLSFASHAGFLQAVEEAGLPVAGVMGTSAGALAGSLFCAGYNAQQVAHELSAQSPISLLRPCWQPWRGGILSMHLVTERLRELLPPTFEELPMPLAVGVVGANGQYRVVREGALPEAVTASAAIPILFASVDIPGQPHGPFKDGGMHDRVGLVGWRNLQRQQQQPDIANPSPALVHLISRSSPFSGADDVLAMGERQVTLVRSPKSGVNLLSLGNFEQQFEDAYQRAVPAVASVVERRRLLLQA